MSEKPKRRWFQFHLLTAVLLMMLAGAFVGLNMKMFSSRFTDDARMLGGKKVKMLHILGGWPIPKAKEVVVPSDIQPETRMSPDSDVTFEKFQRIVVLECAITALQWNIPFLLSFLAVVALVSECLLRRREGRKP